MNYVTIILVVLLSLLTITVIVVSLRGLQKQAKNRGIKIVDVAAFRTLMDREDEAFMRGKLSRAEFSRLKRLKIKVTSKYVRRIADNCAFVMRQMDNLRQNSDIKVAETAAKIADLAAQIRVLCVVAFAKLVMEFAFPSMQLNPALLDSKYESLRQNLSRLGSLDPKIPLPTGI